MATLNELLKDYIEINGEAKMILKHSKNIVEARVGDVLELSTNKNPILVCVIDDVLPYETVLMSYLWEMATSSDLIVNFEHPLRDKWILQGDLVLYITENLLGSAKLVGRIDRKDVKIMKQYLEDENFRLPGEKSGTGDKLPVKREFKLFEAQRSKEIFLNFVKEIEEKEKTLFYIPGKMLETLPAVAGREKEAVAMENFIVFSHENKLRVKVINSGIINKPALIKVFNMELYVENLPEEFTIEIEKPVANVEYIAKTITIEGK
ncbi:hypothetical protein [Desulfurobacterium indicum]|uniref:Uncharacterized protein n=1 Tax=Desulfurobacterium indicum TaxID=1914305 RepID=A0A1R1MKU7_9BACT|nr:hypothetical protein [Desulfurobacterium indicum]OMH40386.1 hypothetical protein BLW93_05525 [Desulfurobacterium indicum]